MARTRTEEDWHIMDSFVRKLSNTIEFAKKSGWRTFLREVSYRVDNALCDWRLGVDTEGMVGLAELGISNPDLVDYVPLGYRAIWSTLRSIPLERAQSTFLDYGCGKGRAVVAAATLPYRRVIGVEISAELLGAAKRNVALMRSKRAQSVDLTHADAAKYRVPDDVNVIYFFNPFKGQVLQAVVGEILNSSRRAPRPIYIIYFNKKHFDQEIAASERIRKVSEMHVYPNYSCGIYQVVNVAPSG